MNKPEMRDANSVKPANAVPLPWKCRISTSTEGQYGFGTRRICSLTR